MKPDFPKSKPCRVVIKTTEGKTFETERAYPKGDPRDPLTEGELKRKFSNLADGILNSEKTTNGF